ncbi:GNAT family N-acetyltransferase [Roseibium sp.]|uniref:GNAT family N-acetyltransferase n=1 Tax=Roseibium sp. TaxID=1936156 RepID=UPI003B5196DB
MAYQTEDNTQPEDFAPTQTSAINVRPVRPADVAAVSTIYAHYVKYGTATFEEVPPDEQEMAQRIEAIQAQNYLWLVADIASQIAGYAYLAPHKDRSAYRYTAEVSIYMDPSMTRQGVGTQLLAALLKYAEQSHRFATVMAVVGDSANSGSIALHEKFGFKRRGLSKGLGYKFGQFIDVVYMQLILPDPPLFPPRSEIKCSSSDGTPIAGLETEQRVHGARA